MKHIDNGFTEREKRLGFRVTLTLCLIAAVVFGWQMWFTFSD